MDRLKQKIPDQILTVSVNWLLKNLCQYWLKFGFLMRPYLPMLALEKSTNTIKVYVQVQKKNLKVDIKYTLKCQNVAHPENPFKQSN